MLRRITGIAIFLFIVNAVFGAYVIVTLPRVDKASKETAAAAAKTAKVARRSAKNTRALTIQVCTTNAAYRGALKRERAQIKTAPTAGERHMHEQTVAQLQQYLEVIEPLIDCSSFDIRDPLNPRHPPPTHGNP